MRNRLAGIAALAMLMVGCLPLQRRPASQEFLMGGFDAREWTVGNQASDQDQRLVEFVRSGETVENWTELLTMQVFRKPADPEPIDALVTRIHAGNAQASPDGFVLNVIAQGLPTKTEEARIIYEWTLTNSPPHADQHEVAMIAYGKFSIFRLAYVAKTGQLAPETRAKWIAALKEARIVVGNR